MSLLTVCSQAGRRFRFYGAGIRGYVTVDEESRMLDHSEKRWDTATMRDFILGGSKITADSDCSHEIKRRLLLGRKATTNLDTILKS